MEFFGAIYYSGFHIVTIMASAQRLYQFGYDVLGTMTLFFLLFPGIFMSLVLTFFPSTLVFPINLTACYMKKSCLQQELTIFPTNMLKRYYLRIFQQLPHQMVASFSDKKHFFILKVFLVD